MFTLYRIYYGDEIVYLGRTKQKLQDRIRAHVFKKPMLREIDIEKISKIEYSEYQSQADMFLYEIYFINKYKPRLNKDDKALDELTVELPEMEWKLFTTHLWDGWKEEILRFNNEYLEVKEAHEKWVEERHEMNKKRHNGEITDEEYWDFLENEPEDVYRSNRFR